MTTSIIDALDASGLTGEKRRHREVTGMNVTGIAYAGMATTSPFLPFEAKIAIAGSDTVSMLNY
jgi:hypothetical protein